MRLDVIILAIVIAAGSAAPALGAPDPAGKCGKAVAAGLAACITKASAASRKCFRKTGAACPGGDEKTAKALEKIDTKVIRGCADDAAVAGAGYGPLTPAGLVTRLQDACTREIATIEARVFGGPTGPIWAGADKDGRLCLKVAAKEAGRIIKWSLRRYGTCTNKVCDVAEIEAKLSALADKAEKKLDKKCTDLTALIGVDSATLVSDAREQAGAAASSPCDPLDTTRCLYPFPNDYFSTLDPTAPSGRRVAFAPAAMPANNVAVKVEPARWNVLDGFSVGPLGLFESPDLDLTATGAVPLTDLARSLDSDAPIVMIDAETGAKQLIFVERDQSGPVAEQRPLMIRVGKNLPNGKRFIIAMRDLRDDVSALLPAGATFAAYRDGTPTNQLPVEARRPHMEEIFTILVNAGIPRTDLFLAWDFTTQSVESTTRKLLHMRDDAFGVVLGTSAASFTVGSVDEPLDANIFRRVDGTFEAPLYLTDGGIPGSSLRLDPATGLPTNEGDTFTALYRCIIPYAATTAGAAPAVPARPSLYGHGLLGTEGQTSSGHVRDFASEHNFVICGTQWSGFADEDYVTVVQVLTDFSNFPKFIDRQHQGVLNFMVLARLMIHPDGFASHPKFQVGGESVIDPSDVFYDGNSQGGILGGVLAAFSQDVTRFVLGVPGINYSTLLRRSIDFNPFNDLLEVFYPNGFDRATLLSVAQMTWDQTDPSGHVNHVLSDTYPNTPAKKILYQVAFGDHQVAPLTVEVAARSNGALLREPAVSVLKTLPDVDPYYDIPAIPSYPFDGSAVVIWDSGNPAPPIINQPPAEITPSDLEWADLLYCPTQHDSDPHECPRRQPEARLQKSEFLKTNGAVIDTCGVDPCVAPDN